MPVSRKNSKPPRSERSPDTGDGLAKRQKRCDFATEKQRVPLQTFEKRGLFSKAATGSSRPGSRWDISLTALPRRELDFAPSPIACGVACIDRSWPLRSPRLPDSVRFGTRPSSPYLHAPTADSRAEKRKAPTPLPRRTGDRVPPAAAQSSPMPAEASRTKGRKRGGVAARPDRYAAQISSTIDSEASATSATSVRPPSNTATSTANRRRSPTSR